MPLLLKLVVVRFRKFDKMFFFLWKFQLILMENKLNISGAVKFGDPLTIDQCDLLIRSLRKTNAPNRCAHGRPSIIPLLDVTDLKKKQTNTSQVFTRFLKFNHLYNFYSII